MSKTINNEQQETPATDAREPRRYAWFAIIALLLTVAAWIAATSSGFTALAIGIAALVAGICSLRSHRPIVRNTAITSIIAVAVLIIVVGAFIIALNHFLK